MSAVIPTTIDGWFAGTSMKRKVLWGSTVEEDGLVFGTGTKEKDMGSLVHEMAHFLEIDEDRCLQPGWGLRVPQREICGQLFYEPQTFSLCARELRVMAIQRVLHQQFGMVFDEHYWAKLIVDFIDGVCFISTYYKDPSLGYGTGKSLRDIEKAQAERMAQDILERSEKLSAQDLWSTWQHRALLHDRTFAKA